LDTTVSPPPLTPRTRGTSHLARGHRYGRSRLLRPKERNITAHASQSTSTAYLQLPAQSKDEASKKLITAQIRKSAAITSCSFCLEVRGFIPAAYLIGRRSVPLSPLASRLSPFYFASAPPHSGHLAPGARPRRS
jgi:hypothetical protein